MQLKFDNFNFQVKSENNKNFIYDVVRKKFLRLTPEEWVRQHTIHQLIKNGFSAFLNISALVNASEEPRRFEIWT